MNQITLALVKERLVEQIADNYFCSHFNELEGREYVASSLRQQAIGIANLGRDQFGFDTNELRTLAMEIYNERKSILENMEVSA